MVKLAKLYVTFIKLYLKSKLEYRSGLVNELIANFVLIGVYFSGILILYQNFHQILCWNQWEFLFLFTTNWLSYSLSSFFFWRPMKDMGDMVRSGELDSYLIRPINPLLYLIMKQFEYTFFPRLILAILFWSYSVSKVNITWSFLNTSFFILTLVSGFFIFSGIFIFTGTVSFWTVQSSELTLLLTSNDYGLRTYSDYPIEIFNKGIQLLLTFVFPYAFTGYFAVTYLLEKPYVMRGQRVFMWFTPLIGVITFCGAIALWKKGIKRYGSSGT